ncbi:MULTISPECIES: AAA family ATPase [Streptomyces]|uniref:AAA family ATPase n=1 Tax=Streptomyces TaxID=1883 RepID=UPI001644013E|nr:MULTISPECIES: SMC family ATPase [Streptomyces]MBT3078368.1 AAA family ATPase [Streptomyces sp. COG21]MBT3087682.1 AAA family ATPase [Streptomyces sp. CYG21]MBT3096568.1 AAA family ATPase [Streptomyces sp. CBG30]MBT3104012.1 AAA family ATPase [Streptomyces sp. COG19]MDI7787910.1 SMC family ATPase [Streptomyces cavourensis]
MRLHTLHLQAFGLFAGTHIIDFDNLSADGLFLLHGDTGAGKSTVFAAICYALYGKPPGDRDLLLRSHHAPEDLLTEVTLDVTLTGRRLRIRRIPAQMRPKRSGPGETQQKPETFLSERTTDDTGQERWEAASKSHQEASAEIADLLGMSRDQFCQVVLLPQNEFTKFLHSDAHGRRELLGKLFRTHRFAFVERWLHDHSRTTEKDRDTARTNVLRLAERIHQAAGTDLATEHPAPTPEDPNTLTEPAQAWAQDLLHTSHTHHDKTLQAAATAKTHLLEMQTLEAAARELHQQQASYTDARRQLDLLQEQQPHQVTLRQRRDRARRAQQAAPQLHAADTAASDHADAQRTQHSARHHLLPQHADLDADQLETLERTTRSEAAILTELIPEEDTVHRLTAQLERIDAERQDFATQQRASQDWLAQEPGTRRDLETRREAARQAEQEGRRHHDALDGLRTRIEAARLRDTRLAEVTKAEQCLAKTQKIATLSGQDYLDIRRRRTEGMAAELAATLTGGDPCPVCGSCTHPAPAVAQEGQPTRQDEQDAEATHERANTARDAAAVVLHGLREQAAVATGEAGDTSLTDLQTQHATLNAALTGALARAADQGAVQEELHALDSEHIHHTEQHRSATAGLSARNADYDTLTVQLAELTTKLATVRGTHPTVAVRAAELTRIADRLKKAAQASRTLATAAQTLNQRTEQALLTAKDQGFDTLELAQQALLNDEDLRAIEEEIAQWRENCAVHTAVLQDPALQQAAAQPPADTSAATAARAAADDQHAAAAAAVDAARTRTRDLTALATDLATAVQRLQPLEQAYSTARHLADLVNGNSPSARVRMQLEAYVLAARLEEVVTAANTRLNIMSEGRYTLFHSDHQAARGARSGLGLQITDSWTGRPRKTDTLSGGESFFASLSLALGLADVVTHESGGNPLDTLFIDEGFGTLDEDALHKVLDVLDSLRAHDRTVGVISHVPELRRRIPHRLHVRKNPTGSTLAHLTEAAE